MSSGLWAVKDSMESRLFKNEVDFFDRLGVFTRVGEYLKEVGYESEGDVVIENAMLLAGHFQNVKEE